MRSETRSLAVFARARALYIGARTRVYVCEHMCLYTWMICGARAVRSWMLVGAGQGRRAGGDDVELHLHSGGARADLTGVEIVELRKTPSLRGLAVRGITAMILR